MYISKIYLGDNFVPDVFTDQYRRRPIHAEVTLKEGDSVSEAEAIGEAYIKDYIYRNTVYRPTVDYSNPIKDLGKYNNPIPAMNEIQTKEEPPLTLEQQIQSSPDIKTLEAYRLIVKSSPDLQEIYNDTLTRLSNQ